MTDKFDIIEYLSGLTCFVFDKNVLVRVALDRNVRDVTFYEELDEPTKELLRADLLYSAYLSPNVWASSSQSHGSYSKSIGGQSIYLEEKERLYNSFISIYKKYNDPKLQEIEGGTLNWLE